MQIHMKHGDKIKIIKNGVTSNPTKNNQLEQLKEMPAVPGKEYHMIWDHGMLVPM